MIEQVVGRLHPLLVHLPIGFLVMAVVLKLLGFIKYQEEIRKLLPLITTIAFVSCLAAILSGYILHINESYEEHLVCNHMYFGLALTIITGLLILKKRAPWLDNLLWIITTVLLFITGHFGGTLTHGENYLLTHGENYLLAQDNEDKGTLNIQIDTNNSLIYLDVVKPILDKKCVTCHSSKKQKGGLRLDDLALITKGGKHGNPFDSIDSRKPFLLERIQLELGHENHMPPKGKPQLTSDEKKLIEWWITMNPSVDHKIKELPSNPSIKSLLNGMLLASNKEKEIPLPPISQIDVKIIEELRNTGIVVSPIAQNENYLSINLSFNKKFTDEQKLALLKVKEHVIWLKASGITNANKLLTILPSFNNLKSIFLDNTDIFDEFLPNLAKVKNLKYLNLTNTKITSESLMKLEALKSLRQLFIYGTKTDILTLQKLQTIFPKTSIDTGGYQVPIYKEDTTRLLGSI